jgi:hypothetical protein
VSQEPEELCALQRHSVNVVDLENQVGDRPTGEVEVSHPSKGSIATTVWPLVDFGLVSLAVQLSLPCALEHSGAS